MRIYSQLVLLLTFGNHLYYLLDLSLALVYKNHAFSFRGVQSLGRSYIVIGKFE